MEQEKLLKVLKTRGFKPALFASAEEAAQYVLSLIPAGASVGAGGSVTLTKMKLLERLAAAGHEVYSHATVAEEKRGEVYQLASRADWYISSANALSMSGEIVNIDGAANRVSALSFGVKNIIYVIGRNKITPDLTSALERARHKAAPPNAARLNKKTPCAVTGECAFCNSPDCICNVTTIMHHPTKYQSAVHVLIVDEDLGY